MISGWRMQTASSFQARRRARRGKRPERHSEHPLQGRVGAQGPTGRDAVPGPCSKMQLSFSKPLRPAVLLQGGKPPDGATTLRRLTAAQTHHALPHRGPGGSSKSSDSKTSRSTSTSSRTQTGRKHQRRCHASIVAVIVFPYCTNRWQ